MSSILLHKNKILIFFASMELLEYVIIFNIYPLPVQIKSLWLTGQ